MLHVGFISVASLKIILHNYLTKGTFLGMLSYNARHASKSSPCLISCDQMCMTIVLYALANAVF